MRYQLMGDLPSTRVTPDRVFSRVCVDLIGIFWSSLLKEGVRNLSSIIFVLFVSKQLSTLEIVTDLLTETFLASLERLARREKL